MRRTIAAIGAGLALLALPAAAGAQQKSGGCASGIAAPATKPDPGGDASAPQNAGNTGWTGGTGGSQIGATTQGANPSSKTWQPPTARGLDLASAPEPAPDC